MLALVAIASCSTGGTLGRLQAEIRAEREERQGALDRQRTAILDPVWYAGPGIPAPEPDSLRAEARTPARRFEAVRKSLDAPGLGSDPLPPTTADGRVELWVRGSERPRRWVVLAAAANASAADRKALSRAAAALELARRGGTEIGARCGLLLLAEPFTTSAFDRLRERGDEVLAVVDYEAAEPPSTRADGPGAVLLLERTPDPGSLEPLPPDGVLGWTWPGALPAGPTPDAVSAIARCALIDAGTSLGGLPAGERPYRGSEPVGAWPRLGLTWGLDPGYEGGVSPAGESGRALADLTVGLAWTIAWSLADAGPEDLDRYLAATLEDLRVRHAAATEADRPGLAEAWRRHQNGSVSWLRRLCFGLEVDEAAEIIRANPLDVDLD